MFMPRRTLLNKNMFTPLGNLLYKLFRYILLLGISYVALFPIIKMVSASLSTPEDYYSNSSSFLPVSPTFDNFKNVIKHFDCACAVYISHFNYLLHKLKYYGRYRIGR